MTAVSPRPATGASRAAGPPELGAAIRVALDHLADLADPPEAVRDGRLDRLLRASVEAHLAAPGRILEDVVAAVRTACAHLAATELEDAYLALRAALDRLPRRPSG
ncbi:hypothetical protein ACR9E3_24915 [Actinomycetospora sp. C-140]